jgi:anaerobic magnesium-protoporphyrin IX monomethyl ester cyclase
MALHLLAPPCEEKGLSISTMKRTNLVLVHPPQPALLDGFSAGLVALANWVARANPDAEVEILDLGLEAPDGVERSVSSCLSRAEGRVVVGITTTTSTYQSALRVARAFKGQRDDCTVVLGGAHASPEAEVILRKHRRSVDFVVAGEGEKALSFLLRNLDRPERVPNLVHRNGARCQRNPSAAFLSEAELDQIDPTYEGFGLRSRPGKFGHATYVSARGCPLQCSFCAVGRETIRHRSIPAVIRDLRSLVVDLKCGDIAIEDNFFAHKPTRTLDLCAAIEDLQRTVSFRWDCQTRVESLLRRDVRDALERAGCEAVYMGVEALSRRALTFLGKAANPDFYLRSLMETVAPALLRSRIECYLNLQFAVPGEGPGDWNETLGNLQRLSSLAESRGRVITVFPQLAVVYPGTRHHLQARDEHRYAAGAEVFELFTEWEASQEPVVTWLGDHFAHGTGGIPEGILDQRALRSSRDGFCVDLAAVDTVSRQLEAVRALPGIRVFDYAPFVAKKTPVSISPAERRRSRKRA